MGAWSLGGLGALMVAIMMLPGSVAAPVASWHVARLSITSGGVAYGNASFSNCTSGVAASHGYVCFSAQAGGANGYARGWQQVVGNTTTHYLNGIHTLYAIGHLDLGAGFAHLKLNCSAGQYAYGRIYIFFHVWIFDQTLNTYVDESNSGYLWDSGYSYCSPGGPTVKVGSPAMHLQFNTSTIPNWGSASYNFTAGHAYNFTDFIGCTAEVDAYSNSTVSAPITAIAGCNNAIHPARDVFTLGSVDLL